MHRTNFTIQRWVLLLFSLGVLLRIVYIVATPLPKQEGTWFIPFNDELAHYHHVLYQRDFNRMPHQFDRIVSEEVLARGDGEYWQPTLYYQLCGLFLRLSTPLPLPPSADVLMNGGGSFNPPAVRVGFRGGVLFNPSYEIVFLRFVSLFLWLAGLFILLKLLPFPQMRTPLLLSTLLGLWLPMSATINNDALLWLWVAILYGFATYAARNGLTRYEGLLVCGVFLLAMYTKLSALPLLPMVLATLWIGRRHQPVIIRLVELLVAGTLMLDLLLPLLFLRNVLYGSPFGVGQALPVGIIEGVKAFAYTLVAPVQEWWGWWYVKVAGVLLLLLLPMALWRAFQNVRMAVLSTPNVIPLVNGGARGGVFNQPSYPNETGYPPESPPHGRGVKEEKSSQQIDNAALLLWSIGVSISIVMWVIYAFYNYQFEARLLLTALPGMGLVYSLYNPFTK